jgi:hypothetical protein
MTVGENNDVIGVDNKFVNDDKDLSAVLKDISTLSEYEDEDPRTIMMNYYNNSSWHHKEWVGYTVLPKYVRWKEDIEQYIRAQKKAEEERKNKEAKDKIMKIVNTVVDEDDLVNDGSKPIVDTPSNTGYYDFGQGPPKYYDFGQGPPKQNNPVNEQPPACFDYSTGQSSAYD